MGPARRITGATKRNRYISAQVQRQVWARDEARCCYLDDQGRRCSETARLELHHRVPYANGGSHDAKNLELRCVAHNDLAAEQDFGREHMAARRGELPAKDPRRRGPFLGTGRTAPRDVIRVG
ncbi:MAG TPA: HNH endonuclease [Polyangiaceae bacterium]|nr:HNH endonuclease [Polyangiaceae bacterium]